MKKAVRVFAVGALFAAMALSFGGCSVFGHRADDNYPYDISAQGGYSGTEAEWLSGQETAATVYRRLYEEAKADGSFTGTYFEFLKSLGTSEDATPYLQRALLSVVSITCRFPARTSAEKTVTSSGAGVILELDKAQGDAYLLTNYHVLYSSARSAISEEITVYLYGGEDGSGAIEATYFGGAMNYDLALLRVENSEVLRESDAAEVIIADSDSVIAGEPVYAVGNPLNKTLSVVGGVVSVEEEWLAVKAADEATNITLPEIRIDATVNHGNSGGALFNGMGELIGIVNARDTREDVIGFGYAIPINFALAAAQNMLENGGNLLLAQDGLILTVQSSHAAYDEALGRTHISEKIVVDDYNTGIGAALRVERGDTLISGYVIRGGVRMPACAFTRRGRWEAFLFTLRSGDTLYLTVSREGSPQELQLALTRSSYFSRIP